jgi:hypothetical protein
MTSSELQWDNVSETFNAVIARWSGEGDYRTDSHSCFGHQPSLGEKAFLITVFSPASEGEIANFEKDNVLRIPEQYRSFLTIHNGAKFFHRLDFGGVIVRVSRDSVRLDRKPISLAYGNGLERNPFVPDSHFAFGGIADYSASGEYFLTVQGKVEFWPCDSDTPIDGGWSSLSEMLQSEILRIESMCDHNGLIDDKLSCFPT